jgi:hypothetical protein
LSICFDPGFLPLLFYPLPLKGIQRHLLILAQFFAFVPRTREFGGAGQGEWGLNLFRSSQIAYYLISFTKVVNYEYKCKVFSIVEFLV